MLNLSLSGSCWKVLEVPDNLSKRLWSVNSKGTGKWRRFLVSCRWNKLTVWLTTRHDEFLSDSKPYQRWLSSRHDILLLRGDGMWNKGWYVRNCNCKQANVTSCISDSEDWKKKCTNEWNEKRNWIIRYGNLREGWIMYQNNAILFTGFNARVFSGKHFLNFLSGSKKTSGDSSSNRRDGSSWFSLSKVEGITKLNKTTDGQIQYTSEPLFGKITERRK